MRVVFLHHEGVCNILTLPLTWKRTSVRDWHGDAIILETFFSFRESKTCYWSAKLPKWKEVRRSLHFFFFLSTQTFSVTQVSNLIWTELWIMNRILFHLNWCENLSRNVIQSVYSHHWHILYNGKNKRMHKTYRGEGWLRKRAGKWTERSLKALQL